MLRTMQKKEIKNLKAKRRESNYWRSKIKYADYNEGYTFYYNSIPQENKLDLLLQ